MPLGRLLEGVARVQRLRICPGARNDLQADGQSAFCESAWDGKRGQTREIEWRDEAQAVQFRVVESWFVFGLHGDPGRIMPQTKHCIYVSVRRSL